MSEKNVKFKHMKDGDKEDYLLLQKYEENYVSLTYERIIEELTRQGKNTMEGYKITRLDHGLQSATRLTMMELILIGLLALYFMISVMGSLLKITIGSLLKL